MINIEYKEDGHSENYETKKTGIYKTVLICDCCKHSQEGRQNMWWHLDRYFGITGLFCSICYAKVSHNSFGEPKHPKIYEDILQRFEYDDDTSK
jgi:hypothetical protein